MTPGWAAIFDWDGVIVDSSRQHEMSWERLAQEEGLPLPPGHFRRGFGMKNEAIIPGILGWDVTPADLKRMSLRKEALFREIVREGDSLHPLRGVKQWLDTLAAAQIPCAVASSTHRENIELALEVTHLREYFRTIVAAEDVHHGKPDPDVFLSAARALKVAPSHCVVFEDAHVGIQAAHAGGMKVIAVATTHPIGDLAEADLAVHRLDDLDTQQIASWFHPSSGH